MGINKGSIAKCCRGERKMAGGFNFKYNKMSKKIISNSRESNQLQSKEGESIDLDNNNNNKINNNIIYVTDSNVPVFDKDNSTNTGVHSGFTGRTTDEIYARFAPFMESPNVILVAKKVEYNLKKYVPKGRMKKVHKNPEVAKEICLILISNLSSTYYLENK